MKKAFLAVHRALDIAEKAIVGTGVLAASFIIFVNVVMRYGFSHSFAWAEELTRYIMFWVTFLGGNLCVQNNIHVKMDLLHVKLPKKAAKALVSFTYLVCIAGCVFLLGYGVQLTNQIFTLGQVATSMPWLKMWVVNLAIPIFAVIGIKDYLWLLILNIRSKDEIVKTLEGAS